MSLQQHVQPSGNCGQWHGRAETYITRNHLGGVILGVTPTTQERVVCSVMSCKQIKGKEVLVTYTVGEFYSPTWYIKMAEQQMMTVLHDKFNFLPKGRNFVPPKLKTTDYVAVT
jgi:hypothetical protein